MSARESPVDDRDWWMAHVLLALFGLLVAAILRVVPGWSAPLHAWIALAALLDLVLALHAGLRAGVLVTRRRARPALLALLLAFALGIAATALLKCGRAHPVTLVGGDPE